MINYILPYLLDNKSKIVDNLSSIQVTLIFRSCNSFASILSDDILSNAELIRIADSSCLSPNISIASATSTFFLLVETGLRILPFVSKRRFL